LTLSQAISATTQSGQSSTTGANVFLIFFGGSFDGESEARDESE